MVAAHDWFGAGPSKPCCLQQLEGNFIQPAGCPGRYLDAEEQEYQLLVLPGCGSLADLAKLLASLQGREENDISWICSFFPRSQGLCHIQGSEPVQGVGELGSS